MRQMFRNCCSLIVLCVVVLGGAIAPGAAAARQGRFKLAELYPEQKIARVLAPRDQWQPWPRCADRRAWENLPDGMRKDLIANGQEYLG